MLRLVISLLAFFLLIPSPFTQSFSFFWQDKDGGKDLKPLAPMHHNDSNSCVLRHGETGAPVPHRVLLLLDSKYFEVFQNWLMYYKGVCPGEASDKNLEIVCMDIAVTDMLHNHTALRCSPHYTAPSPASISVSNAASSFKSSVWIKRLEIINMFLMQQQDVLVSDTDAFWLRSPYTDLTLLSEQSDIVASRGWFPIHISEQWGSTLCMGFLYIKASDFTRDVFNRVLGDMHLTNLQARARQHFLSTQNNTYIDPDHPERAAFVFNADTYGTKGIKEADDQWSLNTVLFHSNLTFPEDMVLAYREQRHTGQLIWGNASSVFNVTLLPESLYVRNCANNLLKHLGKQDAPTSQLRLAIRHRISNATVAHCLIAPGDSLKKRNYLVFYSLWLHSYEHSEVVRFIQLDTQRSVASIRSVRQEMERGRARSYQNLTSSEPYIPPRPIQDEQRAAIRMERRRREVARIIQGRGTQQLESIVYIKRGNTSNLPWSAARINRIRASTRAQLTGGYTPHQLPQSSSTTPSPQFAHLRHGNAAIISPLPSPPPPTPSASTLNTNTRARGYAQRTHGGIYSLPPPSPATGRPPIIPPASRTQYTQSGSQPYTPPRAPQLHTPGQRGQLRGRDFLTRRTGGAGGIGGGGMGGPRGGGGGGDGFRFRQQRANF